MKKANLFICHHPSLLPIFKNFAVLGREKDAKIILFKINHPYFDNFDFKDYQKHFDKVVEFDFVGYQINFLKGWMRVAKFVFKLEKTFSELLAEFEEINVYMSDSAWLPINLMLCFLSLQKNIKKTIRFSFGSTISPESKKDKIKTFFASLYTLPFRCYKIEVLSTPKGKFLDFAYKEDVLGAVIKIINPNLKTSKENKKEIPYPAIFKESRKKRNMVIVFGDSDVAKDYKEYIADKKEFDEKIKAFFTALEEKYKGFDLYYKPHPGNEEKFMEGINPEKYKIIGKNKISEEVFDLFSSEIKAVYSFCSSSIIKASFYNIPSYTFYSVFLDKKGTEKWDEFFLQKEFESKFVYHIKEIKEIGKIDNLKSRKIDYKNLKRKYIDILNI